MTSDAHRLRSDNPARRRRAATAESTTSGTPAKPRAMSRVLRLLDCLSHHRDGMTLSALSRELGVAKSTFVDTLRALTQQSYLRTDGTRYRLGPQAYRFAGTILANWSQTEMLRHHIRELATVTTETVGFAVVDWEIEQLVYTDTVTVDRTVRYTLAAGGRASLVDSVAGRVLLAYAPQPNRDQHIHRHFKVAPSSVSATESAEQKKREQQEWLNDELIHIRQNGYAAGYDSADHGTTAVAVPVFNIANHMIGCLVLAAPASRFQAEFDHLLSQTLLAARRASGRSDPEYDTLPAQ